MLHTHTHIHAHIRKYMIALGQYKSQALQKPWYNYYVWETEVSTSHLMAFQATVEN